MYFAIKPINNSTYYNRESLELIKNLQSLGQNATGRLSTDRQNLQIAEYQKLQQTLNPSNEQKIQSAETPFSAMVENTMTNSPANNQVTTSAAATNNQNEVAKAAEQQTGATQLAELNKYQLGIAA